MERTINVEVALNGLQVQEKPIFCQGDKNTHFLSVKFMEDVDLTGYTLQVYYLPPYPCVTPYVDLYSEVTSNPFKVPIPNKILERNGQVKVEFSLSKESELITMNKTFNFEVIRTMNGTGVTAYPEGTLKETIAQQIEKIKGLLADTDTKIEEYNNNATEKTQSFNDNAAEKLKAYNDNDVSKTTAYNKNANEKLETYNDNSNSKTSDFNENAERKTAEFDTHVKNTTDNAYVEMDKKATEYANIAGERANEAVIEQGNIVLKAIREVGSNQVGAVENAGSTVVQEVVGEGAKQAGLVADVGAEEIEKIQTAGTQAVSDINANKDAHVKAVTDEGNKQVLAVGNKGTEEVSKVQSAGAKAVEDVNANKTANIQAVTEEGTKQTELVRTEGEKQIGLVVDKGTEQTTAIENKGTEETSKVTGEGSKQIKAVQNQGTVSLEAIINIQKQIEQLLKNQEAIGNALALNGKTGVQYDKEIQSVAGMNFDPDLQYLNDAGTKKVGFCYLDRLADGIFECIKQTTAVVNDSACFRNFSNKENSDRLGNLSENIGKFQEKTLIKNEDLNNIISEGMYYSTWNNTCLNTPDPNYKAEFLLKVFEIIKGGSYKIQIFICCSVNCDVYIRGWNYAQNKYGPWKKFNLADIPI